jgi:hypothetical protein
VRILGEQTERKEKIKPPSSTTTRVSLFHRFVDEISSSRRGKSQKPGFETMELTVHHEKEFKEAYDSFESSYPRDSKLKSKDFRSEKILSSRSSTLTSSSYFV